MPGFDYGAPPATARMVRGYGSVTDTTTTQLIPKPGPGYALMITFLVFDNSNALNKTGVDLYSGSTKILGPVPVPAAGGAIMGPMNPPLFCAANEAFSFKPVGSVDTISVSAVGYVAEAAG